ncbi:ATP-grasp domain-containing protein [Planococcus sp. CPCC 101016]|uniref:ATP-grasp domain-containing protein n=1 Tax=Planococcus sp. CPCC 101016 TaxID=2599617 RepID=UPI0011B45DC7|nr:ATP-grasp domain-containing protein [Planococcus sp. CPCC 101016]TWT07928.1 ATP-grasp domain-containing protein [Planococcus sp. CPCC 101016]
MKKINVLVTGIGGPTAQGLLRGFLEKDNVFAVGADRRRLTSGNQFCDKTYQIPRFTDEKLYKQAIAKIIEEEKIDVVFPSLHEEIELFHKFREELDVLVALPESNHFEVLSDKEKVYEFLSEHQLSQYIPKYVGFTGTQNIHNVLNESFPDEPYVVVKEVTGYGSMGFSVVTNRKNYLAALKAGKNKYVNVDDYCDLDSNDRRIAMEYLAGKEYSVDVLIHNGKVVTAVPRERTGVSSGIVLDGKVVYNEELIEGATRITEILADNGFLNLQFFKTSDGYKLTDVNARFCGSQVMSLGAGVNFPYLYLQYNMLQEYIEVQPRWNTRMIRFRDQFFVHED